MQTETTMGKKDESTEKKQVPSVADELLKNRTVTLTGKTREEVDEQAKSLPAGTFIAGAVGRSREDGTYMLRIDLKDDVAVTQKHS